MRDASLRHCLQFGVGLHHAGLAEADRQMVERLYVTQKIQVGAAWCDTLLFTLQHGNSIQASRVCGDCRALALTSTYSSFHGQVRLSACCFCGAMLECCSCRPAASHLQSD